MSDDRAWWAAAVLGALAVVTAVLVAVERTSPDPAVVTALVALLTLGGIAIALWKLRGRPDPDRETAAPPWSPEGALVREAPERTPDDLPVSGTTLAHRIDAAVEAARRSETVADGLAVVRPALRETLLDVLVQSGTPRATAEDLLATGEWTDDGEAAAVLDERVTPPRRSLRERLLAWLFPARAVRRRTERAVAAIARTASAELPTLVGQRAPRSVPVTRPTLEDLQRAADGTLRRADGPLADPASAGADATDPDTDRSDAASPNADGSDATDESAPDVTGQGGDDRTATSTADSTQETDASGGESTVSGGAS